MLGLLLSGCASYQSRVKNARQYFEGGLYESSINELKPLADKEGGDQFLYLVDLGTVYLNAGKYKEAIATFHRADRLAEINDYTSITEEAATVLLNDDVKEYRGEDFEKILVNVYLAIAYTLNNQWEDALVECRKVNHKLDLMIREGQLPYERNAFAKYLAALLFEARGEYNDAFVDYRQLRGWDSKVPLLGAPLLRLAEKLKASDEFQKYRKDYPVVKDYRIQKNEGQIVLLLEQGKGPEKVTSRESRLLPAFSRRFYRSRSGELSVDGVGTAPTEVLFDIENTAIEQLEKKKAAMLAKKIGGVVVKELVAAQVAKSTDNKWLGFLTSVILHATDHADTRAWSTLPATLQIARLTVPAGEHTVHFNLVDRFGTRTEGRKTWDKVSVKPRQIVFLRFRELN